MNGRLVMEMLLADNWKDYELFDTGGGEKLERWGKYTLRRPDPQAIWPVAGDAGAWEKADAYYHRSKSGGGSWEYMKKMPEQWTVKYKELAFYIEPTGFKHTGLFPEQAVNWDWFMEKISSSGRKIKVLNLFAYTGGATVAAAYAGAEVCHVDAAKGMVARAKENLELSGLSDKPVRFITDDVLNHFCINTMLLKYVRKPFFHILIVFHYIIQYNKFKHTYPLFNHF